VGEDFGGEEGVVFREAAIIEYKDEFNATF
jgi:hypothetical protein